MIRGKYLYNKDDLTEVFKIRKKVFQEEQGINEEVERDIYDEMAIHALLYDENEKPVATGRIVYDGEEYKIGRVAVLKEERGKKYGDFLVRMLADKAFVNGAKEVFIDSQYQAINFYKTIGFKTIGKIFIKEGRKQQKMILHRDQLCKECKNK